MNNAFVKAILADASYLDVGFAHQGSRSGYRGSARGCSHDYRALHRKSTDYLKCVLRTISVLLAIAGMAGCERVMLDTQAKELCGKDGGIRVYETVTLPQEMFDDNGNVLQETRVRDGRPDTVLVGQYRVLLDVQVLKPGDPIKGQGLLERFHSRIVRISDGHLVAESVQYRRSGGDLIAFGHHTTYVCPIIDGGLSSKVFKRQRPTIQG